MKRSFILLVIASISIFLLFSCDEIDTGTAKRDLAELVDEKMLELNVPGVSIAVIRDFKIDWTETYGIKDIETNEPVEEKTLFQAASISKSVAAMAVLKLVESGLIEFDEDINESLIYWKLPENEFTESKKVSLKHLLSHTGGLTVHGFRGYKPSEDVPTLVEVLDGDGPANSDAVRVDREPGEYRYSGGGYTIMQKIMIDIEQKLFPRIMHERVFKHVKMEFSTYDQPLPEGLVRFAATGHRNNGTPVRGRRHIYPEMAAAGLWTTPTDLAKFLIEIQLSYHGRSNNVLSQEMTKLMLTPVDNNYGLGLSIREENGVISFGHGGSNEGFKCTMRATVDGNGYVIMTNGDKGPGVYNVIVEYLKELYNW
ncbi:MAG: beta-lactamase family protein [bacterium]|nr:beta-lactamase family protein [bacterium]